MRKLGLWILAVAVALPVFYFGLAESAEVVVLETAGTGGSETTRLWVVDHEGHAWLRTGDAGAAWLSRLRENPEVFVTRAGQRQSFRAVVVDEHYRTNVESVYALGDVTNRLNLTPVAIEEGIVFAHQRFADEPDRRLDYDHVPTGVFSQPPVATVGLAEHDVPGAHVYESEFRPMKHTMSGRTERAYMKLVVEPETDRVLGVHLVGLDAPEIIQGFAVALRLGVTKAQLDATVGLHPTAAEELVTMRTRRPDGVGMM